RDSDFAFQFAAPRAGDLAGWLGLASQSRLPVAARGQARLTGRGWRLEDTKLKVGRSEITLDVHQAGTPTYPIMVVSARSPLIDVPELSTLRAHSPRASTRSRQEVLDAPILPYGIHLGAADIALDLKRVVLGRGELADVGASARIRDGRLMPSR